MHLPRIISLSNISPMSSPRSPPVAECVGEADEDVALSLETLQRLDSSLEELLKRALDEHTKNVTVFFEDKYQKQLNRMMFELRKVQEDGIKELRTVQTSLQQSTRRLKKTTKDLAESNHKITTLESENVLLRKRVEMYDRLYNGDLEWNNSNDEERQVLYVKLRENYQQMVLDSAKQMEVGRQLEVEKMRLEELLEALKRRLEKKDAMYGELEQASISMNSRLTSAKEHTEELQGEMNKLVNDLDSQVTRNRELAAENDRLNRTIERNARASDEMNASIHKARKKLIFRNLWFRTQLIELQRQLSTVLEMDEKFVPEITCRHCLEIFTYAQVLKCGHSLCSKCVYQVSNSKRKLECPECGAKCSIETTSNKHIEGVVARYRFNKLTLEQLSNRMKWLNVLDQTSSNQIDQSLSQHQHT